MDNKRDYSAAPEHVVETYRLNHVNQTFNFNVNIRKQFFDGTLTKNNQIGIWDALELSEELTDHSDPDLNLPQIVHALQTAEGMRSRYPKNEELHVVSLIHDIGKLLLLPEFGNLPQWAVVGDIYPVGCAFRDSIVYSSLFSANPDMYDSRYNSKSGIYKENCGLDSVLMSWGHDEYMYRVLSREKNNYLSDLSMSIIRYHSFYSFHNMIDYQFLASAKDICELLPVLQDFSYCDLYTKDNNNKLDLDDVKTYYAELIDSYLPGKLVF